MSRGPYLFLFFLFFTFSTLAQVPGQIHGNVNLDAQYYLKDTLIGAEEVPQKTAMNGYGYLNYTLGNFSAGVRYEAYYPPLLGYDRRYEGQGIPYRFAKYRNENLEVTIGNFYEQFGSRMILRAYQEKGLGVDNALDGFRVKYSPHQAITLKGIYGKQRYFWDKAPGIVRGIDADLHINQLSDSLMMMRTQLFLGGSFVSKYQADNDPTYNFPENVGAYAARFNLFHGMFSLKGEYVEKVNDPSADNNLIYKKGRGLFLNASYSLPGLGINVGAKSIDNMSFRSDRFASLNNAQINYLPALSKQHTYNLAATLYPYGTQPNGETAVNAEVLYKFKEGTFLGGKNGMGLTVNLSMVNSPDTTRISGEDPKRQGYETNFLQPGNQTYFRDFNAQLKKKFTDRLKATYTFFNIVYNKDVIQGLQGKGTIYADIHVLDVSYKINDKHNIRVEAQTLFTDQDKGDWATGVLEYTVSPHWFISIMDQYNYGNDESKKRIHYVTGTIGYINKGNRISVGYGRQRAGIFCVGGVCRNVPASNGFRISISSSF